MGVIVKLILRLKISERGEGGRVSYRAISTVLMRGSCGKSGMRRKASNV